MVQTCLVTKCVRERSSAFTAPKLLERAAIPRFPWSKQRIQGHGKTLSTAKDYIKMSTAARRGVEARDHRRNGASSNGNGHARVLEANIHARTSCVELEAHKPRVYVAAENRLLREALSRMLTKNGEIEVISGSSTSPVQEAILPQEAEIMLLSSKGNLDEDLSAIRKIRSDWPGIQILLIDVASDDAS